MNVGLVGYGYWGRVAARAIARVARLSVIIDPDEYSQKVAHIDWDGWGVEFASTLQHAADDLDLQAVWVCTPTRDHYRTVKEALGLGLHVLCEKPFVTTTDESVELARMAVDQQLALMVGHLMLHTKLHDVRSTWGRPVTIAVSRKNTEASVSDGSVLHGIGPHEISPLLDLYGIPAYVTCEGTEHRVQCVMGWFDPAPLRAIIELDWLAEKRERLLVVDGRKIEPYLDGVEPTLREMSAFLVAIQGGDRNRWYADALRTTEVLERLEQNRVAP